MKAKFELIGNLTRDPEMKSTASGMAVANMSVACNRRVKKGDNYENEASFFNVTMFGKQAEVCEKYMAKGDRVGFDGYMRQESWEKDGKKNSVIKFYATELFLLGSKKSDSASSGDSDGFADQGGDDDVPF
jgi:single-strand DNA-binding protein